MSAPTHSAWLDQFDSLWVKLGPETRDALLGLLGDDWSFEGKRILDFGSGPGRTLKEFLTEAEAAEFWGVDIDQPSIDKLRRTLVPPMHAARCDYWPPLEFESGSLDLAWAISVFTHLTDSSIAWLLELHRILKPGGLLIATYMGRWASEFIAGETWDEDRVGMNVLRHDQSPEDGAPMVLISDWWLREHWGRAFEVVRIEPQIHNFSWALLRKREVSLTVDDVARPGEDKREYLALRHNLAQTQRELTTAHERLAEQQREAEADLAAVRDEFEHSHSWRLTRPLREALRLARERRAH